MACGCIFLSVQLKCGCGGIGDESKTVIWHFAIQPIFHGGGDIDRHERIWSCHMHGARDDATKSRSVGISNSQLAPISIYDLNVERTRCYHRADPYRQYGLGYATAVGSHRQSREVE